MASIFPETSISGLSKYQDAEIFLVSPRVIDTGSKIKHSPLLSPFDEAIAL